MSRNGASERERDLQGDARGVDRGDWFVRAAEEVGDLTSPFYEEERQRDVWNEACAVGFQLLLWLGTAAAAAMVWIGAATALPYAVSVFLLVGFAAGVTSTYARKLGVSLDDPAHLSLRRLAPYYLLLSLFLAGAVRALLLSGTDPGIAYGTAGGALVGFLAAAWGTVRARRRRATTS